MKRLLAKWTRPLSVGLVISLLLMMAFGVFYLIFIPVDCSKPPEGVPVEIHVTPIEVTSPLSRRSAEISGMDWYGDTLIILPQYFNHAVGRVIYAIPKSAILEYLANPGSSPLEPIRIPVDDQNFGDDLENGFEGYESVAFIGNQIFLTVEVSARDGMVGYIISGEIEPDLSRVVLDIDGRQTIPLQQQIDNTTNEALFPNGDKLVTLFEANGVVINPEPVAQVYDSGLNLLEELPFPTIEYRVTDATRLDADNNFWVLNIYSLGTVDLKPQNDQIGQPYRDTCRHPFYYGIERLVEMHYDPVSGISLTSSQPIFLSQNGNLFSRNWEAIVRLDDLGFLIASDKYPETEIGFVPLP